MKVGILGAGSWGTALAKHTAEIGHQVRLWVRSRTRAETIINTRENADYLPGHRLPDQILITTDAHKTFEGADLVISAIPAQKTREVWTRVRDQLPEGVPILCASKGIENQSLKLMLDVLEDVVPGHPLGCIGGPSFAKEVAERHPTALVIGSKDAAVAESAQAVLSSDSVRCYRSDDVVGVELGGALKNIIAIGCGAAEGLGLGQNTQAALVTRGLAEIGRLAQKMGAEAHTLSGLAGLGDLVLTCTGNLSRNRRVGIALGRGEKLSEILAHMGQVAEGVESARAAWQLASQLGVDMPITREVYRILYEDKAPKEVVLSLMRRALKPESLDSEKTKA